MHVTFSLCITLRFTQTGDTVNLHKSIANLDEAIKRTNIGCPDRAMYLNNLAINLSPLFERLGSVATLKRSIQCSEEAVNIIGSDDPRKAGYLITLARLYWLSSDESYL